MRKLIVSLISLIVVCVAPTFAQVEETRISFQYHTDNNSSVALKSNLLYDAVLVPNLGVEVKVYDNWTVYGDLMYAGWNIKPVHFYWNLYGLQFGTRRYFGQMASQRSMTGHHLGVYCQALAYDLQAGNLGQQTPVINMGTGIEYGYSLPISPSLNLDVEIGVGYLTGKYHEYVVDDEHYTWRGIVQRQWFGPTKASVSLVWLLKSRDKHEKR